MLPGAFPRRHSLGVELVMNLEWTPISVGDALNNALVN